MKVLSIDDSKSVHAYIKSCFSEDGHSVELAFNGTEGLNLLDNNKYDVILLDWEMPGMNGIEVLIKIREKGIKTPIIMVTTKNDISNITDAIQKGANDYVMKPFTPEILFEKIDEVL